MSNANDQNLWLNTDGYGATGAKLPYLTDEQNCRLERIRCGRMLFRGQHEQFYLHESRTRFHFPVVAAQGWKRKLYCRFNVLRLVTLKSVDLLLGEQPAVRVDDALGQEAVDDLVKRARLHGVLYTAVKEASWAAEGMVEVIRWSPTGVGGEVYVQGVCPGEMFPVGEMQPDGQYASYVRYSVAKVDSGQLPVASGKQLLLETTYEPGVISRRCFELNADGKRDKQVDLAQWTLATGNQQLATPLRDVEATGIQDNTIVWMANEMEEGRPVCDYDGLIEPQDRLNAKVTQIARVLAKHADPKLGLPESAVGPDGTVPASHDVFFFRSKEEIPAYLVWNAELSSAMADRDFALSDLCIEAECSPVLLGLPNTAAADTARGLRLRSTNSLAKAKRKAAIVQPFIERVVNVALKLASAATRTTVAIGPVGVEVRDGLPIDDIDQANSLATLKAAGLLSVERGVNLLISDPEAAAKELTALEEDAKAAADAATPDILMQTDSAPEPLQTQTPEGGDMGETPMPRAA